MNNNLNDESNIGNMQPMASEVPNNVVNHEPVVNEVPNNVVNNVPMANEVPNNVVNNVPMANEVPNNVVNNVPMANEVPNNVANYVPMANEVPNDYVKPTRVEEVRPLGTTLKNDFIFLLVIVSIILLLSLYAGSLINIIVYSIQLVGFVFGIRMASKQKRGAGYIGAAFGILMMLTILAGDIIDSFLGLLLFIHSVKYMRRYDAQI